MSAKRPELAAVPEVIDRIPAPENTDIFNGARMAQQHADKLRYLTDREAWLIWDGRRWRDAAKTEIMQAAKATQNRLLEAAFLRVGDEERRAQAIKWALKTAAVAKLDAMIKLAASESQIGISTSALNTDHALLTVANGTVNLVTGELLPHAQTDYITKIVNIDYEPAAVCPRWHRFLSEVFANDQDLIGFIKRAVGYSLTGFTREHVFFFLHGNGRNGKGRFIRQLQRIVGDSAVTTSFSTFTANRNQQTGNTPELAALFGARLVTAGEPDEGVKLSESTIKSLTGEDEIMACEKYKSPIIFIPHFKIWIHANHRPEIRGTDDGVWSRPKLIPFNVKFEGSKKDPELDAKLDAEQRGILAWAVEGAMEWFANGLGDCAAVRAATETYREESDAIAPFLADCVTRSPGAFTTGKEVRASYERWCEKNGYEPWKPRTLTLALKERGFIAGRAHRNGDQVRGFLDMQVTE